MKFAFLECFTKFYVQWKQTNKNTPKISYLKKCKCLLSLYYRYSYFNLSHLIKENNLFKISKMKNKFYKYLWSYFCNKNNNLYWKHRPVIYVLQTYLMNAFNFIIYNNMMCKKLKDVFNLLFLVSQHFYTQNRIRQQIILRK